MRTEECVALIVNGVEAGAGARVWADLGSGGGAFTAALAKILGPGATIYSVDLDPDALRAQEREVAQRFAGVELRTIAGDFAADLRLPPLDGILLANSLHFQKDACGVLRHAAAWLKPRGRLIVVEYDIERVNPWVPHPVPFSGLPAVANCARLSEPRLLARRPSRYHGSMYAAVLYPRSARGT